MTWQPSTEDGAIVVTDGERRLDALTTEPHPHNQAVVIARALNALDRAGGDPSLVVIDVERDDTNGTIADGFGSTWALCNRPEGCGLQVVRPGKVQCWCDHEDGQP